MSKRTDNCVLTLLVALVLAAALLAACASAQHPTPTANPIPNSGLPPLYPTNTPVIPPGPPPTFTMEPGIQQMATPTAVPTPTPTPATIPSPSPAPILKERPLMVARLITLKSDASTLGAILGEPGASYRSVQARLDVADSAGLTFQPVVVDSSSAVTIPSGAPDDTKVVTFPTVPAALSAPHGYYKVTFNLPAFFSDVILAGKANVDDLGRVFLNGEPLSPSTFSGAANMVSKEGNVFFSTSNLSLFKQGVNEILISDINIAGPSGAAFFIFIVYSSPHQ